MTDNKPIIGAFTPLTSPPFQPFQNYLPIAFSDELTLLQKVNMLLAYMQTVTDSFNSIGTTWTDVVNWVEGSGLTNAVDDQLNTWNTDGTLANIINQDIFNSLNNKVDQALYLSEYCVGDGVTDDTANFTKALNDAVTNGGQIILGQTGKTYKITSQLSIDAKFHKIDLRDSILDFTGISSGSCIKITSTQTDTNQSPKQIKNYIKNGTILGNKTLGVTAVDIESSTTFVSLFGFEKLYFDSFDVGVNFFNNAWANYFKDCVFHGMNTALKMLSGGSNYGERLNFNNCYFFNSTLYGDLENGSSSVYFTDCSFDYGSKVFKIRGGSIRCSECYFESNTDTDLWFDVDGDNATLTLVNSDLVITGNRTHAIGNVGDTDTNGGIELENIKYWISPSLTYSPDALITGNGRVVGKNVMGLEVQTSVVVASMMNGINNSSFSGVSLGEYSLGGDVLPIIDSTTGNTDSYSLKLATASGQSSTLAITIPCVSGQQPRYRFYYKSIGLDSSNPLYITASYLDKSGNTITSFVSSSIATENSTFGRIMKAAQNTAPKGTASVKLFLNTGSGKARTIWIDDIHLEVS